MNAFTFLVLSWAVCTVSSLQYTYTLTPFGRMLSHCVHEIPEESHLINNDDGTTTVMSSDGVNITLPACDTQNGKYPLMLRNSPIKGLPPNYDGWLQYTAVNTSKLGLQGGFDAFTNVMSVPDAPKEPADILYLFPGLQNMDWIPKADPEPTPSDPFDIIQPVLQYPGDDGPFDPTWTLKSWYVTVNSGAMMSTGLKVKPGDSVLCNMTRTGEQSWHVSGKLKSSGKATTQSAKNARLKLQPWAYNTLECYGCDGCDTYPEKPVTFTQNKLYQGGKELDVPGSAWEVNPKPAKKLQCHEKTTVAANGDTTISFQ